MYVAPHTHSHVHTIRAVRRAPGRVRDNTETRADGVSTNLIMFYDEYPCTHMIFYYSVKPVDSTVRKTYGVEGREKSIGWATTRFLVLKKSAFLPLRPIKFKHRFKRAYGA